VTRRPPPLESLLRTVEGIRTSSSFLVTGLYGLWTIYRRTIRSSAATPTGMGGSNLHASRIAVMQNAP
jgi:hypothetical protein